MDPILEEMRRVKDIADIRPTRYRAWTDHLAARLARLDELEAAAEAKAKAAPRVKVGA